MSISTISFNNASRAQIQRVQMDLRDALVETSSNRHADVGRTLGRKVAESVSFRAQETSLARQLETNTLVTQRLELAEDTLERVFKTAGALRDQLIPGIGTDAFLASARQAGRSALDELAGALNLSVGGQHLFAGTQTDLRPVKGYDEGPGEAVAAHFQAFRDAAGEPLRPADIEAYFGTGFVTGEPVLDEAGAPVVGPDGPVMKVVRFDDLFGAGDKGWNPTFSQASDSPIQSRISASETVASSVSANEAAFRKLTAGYAILDLASASMDAQQRETLVAAARGRIAEGVDGVTALRADLGNRMVRVTSANAAITQQKDIFERHVASLEEIDIVEAGQRVAALRTQLEASLRVTGMIQDINILDYL